MANPIDLVTSYDQTIVGISLDNFSEQTPEKLAALSVDQTVPIEPPQHTVNRKSYKIRLANTDNRRQSASMLIEKMYAWRGYSIDTSIPDSPNCITLVANFDERVVGTLTLYLDSNAGLPADDIYNDELDGLRAVGRRLAEPSRLAFDKSIKTKRLFAALIHVSFIYAYHLMRYTDYVIEVNPRHAAFYHQMLGFEQIGEERICPRVGAPAVLLRLDLDYMQEQIIRVGGLMESGNDRSLYPYFFTKIDEMGITGRLNRYG